MNKKDIFTNTVGISFLFGGVFMREDYKKIILFIMTVVSVLFTMKYVLPYFFPLVIAVLIVVPIQSFCMKKNSRNKNVIKKNGKGVMAGGILFGFILMVALIIVGMITFLMSRAKIITQNAYYIQENLVNYIESVTYRMETSIGVEKGTIIGWLEQRADKIGEKIAVESNVWISDGIKYMAGASKIVVLLLFSMICVVLFAREIEDWQQGLLNIAMIEPAIDKISAIFIRIGKKLGVMLKTYIKTQTVIFIIISLIATIGMYIAGVKEAYFYGILAGIMDFLPFIGTGIVMVPVGVVFVLQRKIVSAGIILLTYCACAITREIVEPHLIGNGLKFSPVAVLIAVYAGIQYYGVLGVILGPITLMILIELAKEIFATGKNKASDNGNCNENMVSKIGNVIS